MQNRQLLEAGDDGADGDQRLCLKQPHGAAGAATRCAQSAHHVAFGELLPTATMRTGTRISFRQQHRRTLIRRCAAPGVEQNVDAVVSAGARPVVFDEDAVGEHPRHLGVTERKEALRPATTTVSLAGHGGQVRH